MNEREKIAKLLSGLPEVTLPESLTAEKLFQRMDSGELTVQPEVFHEKVTPLRRWRPVLSYAAAFALLVLVYYGAGLDSQPKHFAGPETSMPAAAAADSGVMGMRAAPSGVENATAGNGGEAAIAESADEAVSMDEAAPNGVMLAAPMSGSVLPEYYIQLAAELREQAVATGESPEQRYASQGDRDMTVADGELLYRYNYQDDAVNTLTVLNNKNGALLASFDAQGDSIIEILPVGGRVYLLEQQYTGELYAGDSMLAVEYTAGRVSGELPSCGMVRVTVYDTSQPESISAAAGFVQEGRYLGHQLTGSTLTVASLKDIMLPEEGDAMLCNIAPMVGDDSLSESIDPERVHRYPEENGQQYLLLGSLEETRESGWQYTAHSVLGSRLSFQSGDKVGFVFSEAASSGGKPLESFRLGSMTIEMR